ILYVGVTGVTIQNNIISDNGLYSIGIYISETSAISVTGNTITNNYDGIKCLGSYILISGNTISSNSNDALDMITMEHSTISENTFSSSITGFGINCWRSSYNTISGNFITGNLIGLWCEQCRQNLIYNNYFDNIEDNAYDAGTDPWTSTWNISKTPTENIIHGPYLGGNYWSTYYNDPDSDYDGLGDFPYNIHGPVQDNLPLVPTIEIVQPTTGGTATFTTDTGTFGSLTSVDESSLPPDAQSNKPAELALPFGLFDLTITVPNPGDSVTITIVFPSPVPTGSLWWKIYPNNNTWFYLPIGSDDGDGTITVTLADGGLGDNDFTMDGTIHDPGGLGEPLAPPTNNPPYTPNSAIPSNGATGISINTGLSWTGGDPDSGDTVLYDVFFGTTN
ncbi:MAG TPA: NosD domain-containing protein, partial [Candidatus Thermoplasmatota archaeon]|nr:NosD domain-containing protein [Candidatus Thermoplasmatota archaeon]